MSGGQLSGGKNIKIPRLHFYVLHSKFNCIQQFKLYKNLNWTININLMLKLKMYIKIIVRKMICKNNSKIWTRTSGKGVVLEMKFGRTRTGGGLKTRYFGGCPSCTILL